ncbi:MAG: hypothetical protein NPIRA04_33150 [Nitrospirales bacterium]|nr:MAG: hypothetical protein NPIRA04_33150 [Nitrospirales bacterium]
MEEKYAVLKVKSPREAIKLEGECDGYQRTELMEVVNDTDVRIKICFFQALCRYNLSEPYIKNTGVFVGGINMGNGEDCFADPCDAGGVHKPIAATSARCSVKVEFGGDEKDISFPDYPEAEEGKFYPRPGWRLYYDFAISEEGKSVKIIKAETLHSIASINTANNASS